jgi:asparagine synthase (glutamine-hydrolysing)
MCGFAGYIDLSRSSTEERLRSVAGGMADTLIHRGPDDAGVWMDPGEGVALGFRRLAILDLTPEGHQPMASAGGRYVIVFNGEIYNHREIRRELGTTLNGSAPRYRGHSDTEVLLAAIEAWGLRGALERAVGMYAIALWDRRERALHLARDRMGEKPLYYGRMGRSFLFGSELKALRAHPEFEGEIDRDALAIYLNLGYVPHPHCIYRGVKKVPPGAILTLDLTAPDREPSVVPYWTLRDSAVEGIRNSFAGSEAEAVEELEGRLREAIRLQMVADVPVGAFLSGGVDSSTVVALMQAQSPRPVLTFTIGFHETGYNEAQHAAEIARHLGTEHTELYVTPEQAMGVIPRLPTLFDEPFGDPSQIPTFLVSQLARRKVTVSLSGDGGDELFGGYSRYHLGLRLWNRVAWAPRPLRRAVGRGIGLLPARGWDRVFAPFGPVLTRGKRLRSMGDRLHKLAGILDTDDLGSFYGGMRLQWGDPRAIVLGASRPPGDLYPPAIPPQVGDPIQGMMYQDSLSYLPDDIMVKVDRASMGVSLESRAPLLDHRVVEFAWKLPARWNVAGGEGKLLFKKLLYRLVPRSLVDRPKMGFGVPISSWIRGPLRDWAEDLLSEDRLEREGMLDPDPVRVKWSEHVSGDRDWQYPLWNALMFQAWMAEQTSLALSEVPSCIE